MLQTLRLYWEILWRRRQPSDVPYSWALFGFTALLPIAIGIGVNGYAAAIMQANVRIVEPGAPSYVISAVVIALESLGYVLLLRFLGFAPRALQTITAMLGVYLFTGTALLALLFVAASAPQDADGLRGLAALAVFVVGIYDLYIKAWIFSRAAERSVALSAVLVLITQLAVLIIASALLGPKVAEPIVAPT